MRSVRASSLLLLCALCACALALVCAQRPERAPRLPPRPAPPSQGRFAHQPAVLTAPTARSANGARAAAGASSGSADSSVRRFQHAMVLDPEGNDVSDVFAVPETMADAAAVADRLAAQGLSTFKYDVQLAAEARIIDEDLNVRSVKCAFEKVQTEEAVSVVYRLDLTAVDVAAALGRYALGTVVQGSEMWGCVEPSGAPWTILVRVTAATAGAAPNALQLVGELASYRDLFEGAVLLLRQPNLVTDETASSETAARQRSPGIRHPLAVEPEQSVRLAAPAAADLHVVHAPAPDRHAVRLLNNELRFSSPSANLNFAQGDSVTISFTGYSDIEDWSRARLTLRRFKLVGSDDDRGSITPPACATPRNSDECSITVSLSSFDAEASLQGYYFTLEYKTCKKVLIDICTTESSDTAAFWIPLVSSGRFNQAGLVAFSRSCASMQCDSATAGQSSADSKLCALCRQGRDMSLELTCADCDVRYTTQVSLFSFKYSLDPLNLYVRAEARIDATVDAAIDLSARLAFSQRVGGRFDVVSGVPIPPSISLNLGVVSVRIGATFDLRAGYDIDFRAAASVRARAAVSNVLSARAVYDSRNNPEALLSGQVPPFAFAQQPTIQVDATGELGVRLALTPVLSVGISHLIEASVSTDVTVNVHANFSWPAYPALAAPSLYDVDPSRPAFAHFGPCSAPHLVRYAVSAGLEGSVASARLDQDIGSTISPLLKGFDRSKSLGSVALPTFMLPLASGCMLRQNSSAPIVFVFRIDPGRGFNFTFTADLPNLSLNVALDLAQALNTSTARFAIDLLDDAGRLLDDLGRVRDAVDAAKAVVGKAAFTRNALHQAGTAVVARGASKAAESSAVASVRVSVLDADDPAAPSSAALLAMVRAQMANPASPLRSSGVVTPGMQMVDEGSAGGGSSSLSGGAIAGIVIGVLVGVALLALAAYYLLVMRPKQLAAAPASNSAAAPAAVSAALSSPVAPAVATSAPGGLVVNPALNAASGAQFVPLRPVSHKDVQLQVELQSATQSARPAGPPPPPLPSAPLAASVAHVLVPTSPTEAPASPRSPGASPPPLPASSPSSRSALPPPPLPPTAAAAPGKLNLAAFSQFEQPRAEGQRS